MSKLINCKRLEDICDQNLDGLVGRETIFVAVHTIYGQILDLLDLQFVNPNLGLDFEQLLEIAFLDALLVEVVDPNQGVDCHGDVELLIEEVKTFDVHDGALLDLEAAIQLLHVKNAVPTDEGIRPNLRSAIEVVQPQEQEVLLGHVLNMKRQEIVRKL